MGRKACSSPFNPSDSATGHSWSFLPKKLATLARALEGGQETIFNEICDLVTQTQTRIQYKMPFGWSLPVIPAPSTATIHSRVRVLVFGVSFGYAVVYHYRARIRRVTGWTSRWGLQARRFLGRRRRRPMPENVFLPRNKAAARQPHSTSPTTKIPNLSTYCSTLPPGISPPASRNRPYPNIKGTSIPSTPIRPCILTLDHLLLVVHPRLPFAGTEPCATSGKVARKVTT